MAYPNAEELRNPDVEPEPWHNNGWWFCQPCGEWKLKGGPDHRTSPYCQSGSRPHCTCDTCF